MLLADEFLHLGVSASFRERYLFWIQLGAAFAVPVLFWRKMTPFRLSGEDDGAPARQRRRLWFMAAVACAPGAAAAFALKAIPGAEEVLESPRIVAAALLFYGVAFLLVERMKKAPARAASVYDLTRRDALCIGLFQVLSIVPGTSRSGATILGALLLGVARPAAAEFSFFLALPVMAGMSLLQFFDGTLAVSPEEGAILAVGVLAAFATSLLIMRALTAFLRRHTFSVFGWYRIALGAAVLIFLS